MNKPIEELIGKKNLSASPFFKKVYTLVAQIPEGKVSAYGDVAKALGISGAARAVGTAMANNRDSKHVPCHRIVRSDGNVGFYKGGPEGSMEKRKRLMDEGIEFLESSLKIKNFDKFRYKKFNISLQEITKS